MSDIEIELIRRTTGTVTRLEYGNEANKDVMSDEAKVKCHYDDKFDFKNEDHVKRALDIILQQMFECEDDTKNQPSLKDVSDLFRQIAEKAIKDFEDELPFI